MTLMTIIAFVAKALKWINVWSAASRTRTMIVHALGWGAFTLAAVAILVTFKWFVATSNFDRGKLEGRNQERIAAWTREQIKERALKAAQDKRLADAVAEHKRLADEANARADEADTARSEASLALAKYIEDQNAKDAADLKAGRAPKGNSRIVWPAHVLKRLK